MSLIVFEGIDGTGKTTCADKLLVYLVSKGLDCAKFSEPSHSKYGMKIRNAMNGEKRLSVERETELFVKDRKVDVKENIKPALKEGKIVLLDRYYFSTAAYQGSRMTTIEWQAANLIITRNEQFSPIPDLVLFFFADIDSCIERIAKGRDIKTYMERKDNLIRVNDIFKLIHAEMHGKYNSFAINANQDIETVFNDVKDITDTFLATRIS